MLVDLATLLRDARRHRYAVPAFDCTEDVLVRTILETAEARQSPVILMCLDMDLAGNGFAYLPGLIKLAAAHHAVPVALHLDRVHGGSVARDLRPPRRRSARRLRGRRRRV